MRRRIERWAVPVLTTGAVTLSLAGCALPDGVDGDLTGGWSPLGQPVGFVPEVGTCHAEPYQTESTLDSYNPVDCAEEHVTEIVYVGEFADSDRVTRPETGSEQWLDAFASCEDGAADYLGADFRFARLWLGVVVPSVEAWEGGSRWFRCDVLQYDYSRGVQPDRTRTGSLAGALAEDSSELRLGCFVVTTDGDVVEEMDPVGCDEPHHAEFVGVWRAPGSEYLDDEVDEQAAEVHGGCREQVAAYVDVPVDDDLGSRTGTIADWMDEEDWDNGDHGYRCYLWLDGEEVDESLQGAGPDALPVR